MLVSRNYISTSLARSSAVLDGYEACCSTACLSVHGLTGVLLTDTSPYVEEGSAVRNGCKDTLVRSAPRCRLP